MINLGLSRITRLLASTPIPWKAVHVAGTNGKGSVAFTIYSLIHASSIPVGLFTSPHLIYRWDCIKINGKIVSESLFLQVEEIVKSRNEKEKIQATEFEVLTATAFEIFTREKVQYGVVEVGLGGRLDATNVLKPEQVACSVITKIGLDHQNLLGNTIEEIAKEKAGIMKKDVPVVMDESNSQEVLDVLKSHAKDVDAEMYLLKNTHLSEQFLGHVKDLPEPRRQNSLTALNACWRVQPMRFSEQAIKVVLAEPWQGRLQSVSIERLTGRIKPVLLDGAHNLQAAGALADYVDKYIRKTNDNRIRKKKNVVWLIAMSKGRPIQEFVSKLVQQDDEVIVTTFGKVDGMDWVEPAKLDELATIIQQITPNVKMEKVVEDALKKASEIAGEDVSIVLCGSLYLVGDVLRLLEKTLPEIGG